MDAVLDTPKQKRSQRKQISPKQLLYAQLLSQGLTKSEASRKVGWKSRAGKFKADRNPLVQEYLSNIQQSVAIRASHTVVQAMHEAEQGMIFAKETENAGAFVKAVELRAKLSGLLIDRVEVFSMDMKGALDQARSRVIQVNPALEQITQAETQAEDVNRVNP